MNRAWLGALPTVARVGFDDGWLILGPHFLNFRLPSLLVDYRLAGEAGRGLETFGAHRPTDPWTLAAVHIRSAYGHLGIVGNQPAVLIASRWLGEGLRVMHGYDKMIVMVGDTHAVQLSWSALWTCRIGLANVTTSAGQLANQYLGPHPGQPRS